MSQLDGIKPTTTLGQMLAARVPTAQKKRVKPRGVKESTRQKDQATGIAGIVSRGNAFVVTHYKEWSAIHLGSFDNLRSACEALATAKGKDPRNLKGMTSQIWLKICHQPVKPRRDSRTSSGASHA